MIRRYVFFKDLQGCSLYKVVKIKSHSLKLIFYHLITDPFTQHFECDLDESLVNSISKPANWNREECEVCVQDRIASDTL